jgi:hypothetical protein
MAGLSLLALGTALAAAADALVFSSDLRGMTREIEAARRGSMGSVYLRYRIIFLYRQEKHHRLGEPGTKPGIWLWNSRSRRVLNS